MNDRKSMVILLPAPIHKRLRQAALDRDRSMSDIVRELIDFYLADQDEQAKVKSA